MAKQKNKAIEKVFEDKKTKTIYHYIDKDNNVDVKSREVYKSGNKEIHFPFIPKTGMPKYKSLKKITYENLPSTLPAGILKAPTRGYGFTRDLSPLIYKLQDRFPRLSSITVSSNRNSEILNNNQHVVLSIEDLNKARPQIASLNSRHKEEKTTLSNNVLSEIFPKFFKKTKSKYTAGNLANFVTNYNLKPTQLSDEDIQSISNIISDLPPQHSFVKKRKILDAKTSLDKIFIEDVISEYEVLLSQKTETKTLEDKWQHFFRDNILYFNFGYVEKFEKERIQGDTTLDIPDFILMDTYRYLDIFEIKTHLTQLLSYDKGRKNFYWFSEAARAISQAENYIDSLSKQEDRVIKNIRDEYSIEVDAVRPYVYIIASSKPTIAGTKTNVYKGRQKKKMWNDYRRLNNSLKNIRFVLYDELLEVFQNMKIRLQTQVK